MATYERKIALAEVFQKLGEAEEQANNGVPNVDGREVFARLREKHGQKTVDSKRIDDEYYTGERLNRVLHSIAQIERGEIITKSLAELD